MARLLRGEIESFTLPERLHHKDGEVVHARLSVTLIKDGGGAARQFVKQIQDVTSSVLQEQEIARQIKRIQQTSHQL